MLLGGTEFKMALFATPNATDMTDLWEISRFTNSASGGFMFLTLMGSIWTIAFIGAIAEGRKAYRGWIFANFICTILTVPMALLGMIQASYMYFFIILLGFGLVWTRLSESRG